MNRAGSNKDLIELNKVIRISLQIQLCGKPIWAWIIYSSFGGVQQVIQLLLFLNTVILMSYSLFVLHASSCWKRTERPESNEPIK